MAYVTLGCKLNFAETATLRDALERLGAVAVKPGEKADLCLVNTCAVTDVAEHKCRQAIRRLSREHPDACIVVTGCSAQIHPDAAAALPGVELVVGTERKGDVVSLVCRRMQQRRSMEQGQLPAACEAYVGTTADIRTFVPSCSRGDRTRYFLKVQDGCNYYCSYCTIPMARGRSRNGSIASLRAQAEAVAAAGGREVVITGVNIGDFGRSTGESFIDLVRALDEVEGIARYRISSIEPDLLTDEVVDFCAASRAFMPHFHIPLQSGSDTVLRLMRRHYDTALFASRVERIRRAMPDAFIGVDVIVGMRGETADLFEEAYHFVESLPVSQLHVFNYSERPGTRALLIPHAVAPAERHERSQRLIALSEQKRRAFYAQAMGQVRPVLWEQAKPGRPFQGFTDNYIRVTLAEGQSVDDNALLDVRLAGFAHDADSLVGHLAQ